ncbi:MAG: NAD(P)H-dependent glycerol-3-phosphate dehydrogenase [Pseudomonadota bacterium]
MTEREAFSTIGVVGGGAWGTALAVVAADGGRPVVLWARETEVVDSIAAASENKAFLPGVRLPASIDATQRLADLAQCEALLFVAPAQYARPVLKDLAPHLPDGAPLALCSKGIEQNTGALMTAVLAETAPQAAPAVLSGPSFAADVAKGLPTAVTLACPDAALGARWLATLGGPAFRPYLSDDMTGAELGGAIKNVLAIACGVVAGKGFGDSAKAALMARGFAEMRRLAAPLGAKPETFGGLSGLGDLILTCGSPQSRNMSLGMELGRGRSLAEILSERRTVAEGVATAGAVAALAKGHNVDMPICTGVHAIVSGAADVDDVINALLSRPLTSE